MKRLIAIAVSSVLAFSIPAIAQPASITAKVVASCGSATYISGTTASVTQDTTGKQCTGATVTPSGTPQPVTPVVSAPTDRSGAITTGGTSQTLAAANASRKCLLIQNPITAAEQNIATAESLYINNNAVAATVAGAGNYAVLPPGASTTFCPSLIVDQTAATVNATTTAHRWYAKEY